MYFHWFSMSLFPGGQLILASSVKIRARGSTSLRGSLFRSIFEVFVCFRSCFSVVFFCPFKVRFLRFCPFQVIIFHFFVLWPLKCHFLSALGQNI